MVFRPCISDTSGQENKFNLIDDYFEFCAIWAFIFSVKNFNEIAQLDAGNLLFEAAKYFANYQLSISHLGS